VLVTVVIIGSMVWILDYILSGSVRGLKNLAQGTRTEQNVPEFDYDFPDLDLPEGVVIEPILDDGEAEEEQAEDGTQAEAASGDETEPADEPEE